MFGVAVFDVSIKFDELIFGVVDFANDFGSDFTIGGDWPVHMVDSDFSVRAIGAAFGVEKVEINYVVVFEAEIGMIGSDSLEVFADFLIVLRNATFVGID